MKVLVIEDEVVEPQSGQIVKTQQRKADAGFMMVRKPWIIRVSQYGRHFRYYDAQADGLVG